MTADSNIVALWNIVEADMRRRWIAYEGKSTVREKRLEPIVVGRWIAYGSWEML
jgi:hypothetical protein